MDEELNKILTNAELDETAKAEAIKSLVGNNYVPTSKYSEVSKKVKEIENEKNTIYTEYENFKMAKMTEDERKEELAKKEQQANESMRLDYNRMKAENVFAKAGIKEEDYSNLLDTIVSTDLDKTMQLTNAFCNTISKQKKEVEKKITADIVKGATPPPSGNTEGSSGSKLEQYQMQLDKAKKENDFIKMSYFTRLVQEELSHNN